MIATATLRCCGFVGADERFAANAIVSSLNRGRAGQRHCGQQPSGIRVSRGADTLVPILHM
jgi:hypothetical protein